MESPSVQSGAPSSVDELVLRDGTVDDALAIEAVHYASREAVYKGQTADWPPRGLDRSGRVARWMKWLSDPAITCIVAADGGDLAGFCTIRASGDDDADADRTAEMPTLYVRPDWWSRGVGQALCAAGLERARDQGFDALTLWVLEINERAQSFYETFGFEADGVTKVDEATSESLVARRYRIGLEDV